MLLKFIVSNYKLFKDCTEFDMTKAPRQTGLDYSVTKWNKEGVGDANVLSSSVIYGPNAAGKSTIIGALEVLKSIILKGNITNPSEKGSSTNYSINKLELIPNSMNKDNKPVFFYIKFISENYLIEYETEINLGRFYEVKAKRNILKENLKIDNDQIFERNNNNIKINYSSKTKKYFNNINKDNLDVLIHSSENNLSENELFLSAGFKTTFSKNFYDIISNWFKNKLLIVYSSNYVRTSPKIPSEEENKIFIDNATNDAIKTFSKNNNDIGYIKNENSDIAQPYSLIPNKNEHSGNAVESKYYESFGTMRFMSIFPLILSTLKNGSTLVIDEFDASIHPMALMDIVSMFHNDTINKNHAQLIFNTQNPIFLSSNIFRRDEIKFVQRKNEQSSEIYSLSDFPTDGDNSVRKGEDYMKNYFIDKYGAIEDINLSDIIEKYI